MFGIKNRLKEITANGAMRSSQNIQTIGTVVKTDEMNNLVDVCFKDPNGQKHVKENVSVRLYWNEDVSHFPDVDDKVVIEKSGDGCVVVSEFTANYAMELRPRLRLVGDVLSDLPPYTTFGGVIF